MTPPLRRETFRAMGTICAVAAAVGTREAADAGVAIDAARREIALCERALSRFDARSDLSRLNDAGGAWVAVDERLIDALSEALRARTDTLGRFDPTILPALAATGYDRSFELLTERAATPLEDWHAGARFEVDPLSGRARVERGAAVDLGGIGKGFAATRAQRAMRAACPALTGGLVDMGGDIAVSGSPPEGGPWRVDIADPRTPDRPAGTLELTGGGVATSGRDARRFGPGGRLHHLIDPASGTPAAAGPLAVTVTAPSAIDAEAHATALAIAEEDEARAHLAAFPDVAALLIPHLGRPVVIGRLPLARERSRPRLVITTEAGRFPWH